MNARPLLHRIVDAFAAARLEAILVGNAGAALQGAPVTTLDFDFAFRKTRANVAKLKRVATELDATVFRPFHPVSDLYRIVNDDAGLQLDMMPSLHGVRSFESLRSRAARVEMSGKTLLVADLGDIIRSKRAAGRAKDRAALVVLEATLREKRRPKQDR